jgi:hypothetical protein
VACLVDIREMFLFICFLILNCLASIPEEDSCIICKEMITTDNSIPVCGRNDRLHRNCLRQYRKSGNSSVIDKCPCCQNNMNNEILTEFPVEETRIDIIPTNQTPTRVIQPSRCSCTSQISLNAQTKFVLLGCSVFIPLFAGIAITFGVSRTVGSWMLVGYGSLAALMGLVVLFDTFTTSGLMFMA